MPGEARQVAWQVPAVIERARARVGAGVRLRRRQAERWKGSAGVDDPDENIAWNRRRWGDAGTWRGLDSLGYQWGGGFAQTPASVAALADKFLRPYIDDRYDLAILEISPGGGRITAELVRYARRLSLVDLNVAAIEICRQRFADVAHPDRLPGQRRAVAGRGRGRAVRPHRLLRQHGAHAP